MAFVLKVKSLGSKPQNWRKKGLFWAIFRSILGENMAFFAKSRRKLRTKNFEAHFHRKLFCLWFHILCFYKSYLCSEQINHIMVVSYKITPAHEGNKVVNKNKIFLLKPRRSHKKKFSFILVFYSIPGFANFELPG